MRSNVTRLDLDRLRNVIQVISEDGRHGTVVLRIPPSWRQRFRILPSDYRPLEEVTTAPIEPEDDELPALRLSGLNLRKILDYTTALWEAAREEAGRSGS